MGKAVLTFAVAGIKSGTIMLYIVIAVAIVVITGYFLLRKKKK